MAGKRALVVEDESLISMLVESFLEDLGCDVVATAARLEDAMRLAGTIRIDFAVLDVNLDGKLSYPVAELLRTQDVPFFFTTGYGMAGLPESLSGTLVLPKPFQQEQFAAAVAQTTSNALVSIREQSV